ncbi:MAG: PqqD family protein [Oscillospiraceae bacterium]|nr:PqqD family protein [Oscillospiraceae bacterium]
MAKQRDNYLDYVPAVSPRHTWDTEADGSVTIHMEHRGVYAAIAQKLFHCPKVSHIHLDEMGSFVFPLIDGKRTVGDIADLVGEHFGEAANPLYERLAKYMQILRNNGFIYYIGKDKTPKA